MQARELRRLDQSLEGFLAKLTAGLGRSARRCWAGVYVSGLLLDGERKSIGPMASRLGESDHDLQHLDLRRDEFTRGGQLFGGRAVLGQRAGVLPDLVHHSRLGFVFLRQEEARLRRGA